MALGRVEVVPSWESDGGMCRTIKAPHEALDYFMAGGEGAGDPVAQSARAWLDPDNRDKDAQALIESCSAEGMSVTR